MNIMQQRPLLAAAQRIVPYLKRIDENRYYSNVGPLAMEFEKRLSEKFKAPCVTTSSATSGITACLVILNLKKGSFVACPSWTFVATAAAIVAAGHVPYFCDTNEITWEMEMSGKAKPSALVVVSPFGKPLSPNWERLHEACGIPIIIDAAAGFDSVKVGKCPVVISTHATKVFGTGEGGIVLSPDKKFLDKVRTISNFGLPSVERMGINAKMSEYAAAVGLAELDWWEVKRALWLGVKEYYMETFAEFESPIFSTDWASNVFPITVPNAHKVVEKIGMGRTWKPVHNMPAYANYPRTDMTDTNKLADTTLLLPFSIDQTKEEIEFIKNKLMGALV